MINKQSNTRLTKITICNYASYQLNQQNTNKRTTNEQQTNNIPPTTDNNVNKYNNLNKVYSDEIKNFTQSIIKYFPIKPKKIESWYDITDKLIRIDGYKPPEIEIIIQKFTLDNFWSANFQSYTKLRKKKDEGMYIDYFKNILIAENNGQHQKTSTGRNTTSEGLRAIVEQLPDN